MKNNVRYKITLIILSSLLALVTIFNISLAIFSHKKIGSGIIQFSEQRLDIEVLDASKTIELSPDDLTIGTITTKNLKITNPSTSTNCVFRIWLEFKIDNVANEDYLELVIGDGFFKSDDKKFYYNDVLNSGDIISNLQIQFVVSLQDSDISNYENKPYNMKLHVEAVQANREAIQETFTNYPSEWFNNLEI